MSLTFAHEKIYNCNRTCHKEIQDAKSALSIGKLQLPAAAVAARQAKGDGATQGSTARALEARKAAMRA